MGILGGAGLKVGKHNCNLNTHYAKYMICDPLWGAEEH